MRLKSSYEKKSILNIFQETLPYKILKLSKKAAIMSKLPRAIVLMYTLPVFLLVTS